MMNPREVAETLVNEAYCSSLDEAVVIAELLLNDFDDEDASDGKLTAEDVEKMKILLQDYLGLIEDEADVLSKKINQQEASSEHDEDDESLQSPVTINDDSESSLDEEEEDRIPLFDGECELCDRYIKLTRHHLMPKSTWSKLEARLIHAAQAKEDRDLNRARILLGEGLMHIIGEIEVDRSRIRQILAATCDICRPCHDTVHKSHDNLELALSFNSVDKLLQDEQISKFCKWASKQRTGKYSIGR
jgi:hypothetical protein